ncbi:MAG: hypothetical protein A3D31_15960 [Candidatus Fluviicola riflensis]|nr:MAG: hypothetical protein CHH17_00895 [Candidatus Fluviicola riflensis]OGS78453.1 MAG: hypothetical protein A3D31_15960 [Candidatus Fluviicola riflensis]OGS85519.1 MAG: hypothetical protein A2724_12895 [Fluviicola sp. RIFCSPHIGHO2_01_FULL_43_53]OGS87560.1 MAG: hypothetical protein A3E30_09315 [Fluviicola sp. RIFCSPHIGHO2_12_FULL_43_24]
MKFTFYIAVLMVSGQLSGQELRTWWSASNCEIGEQVVLTIQLKKAPKNVDFKSYSGEIPCEIKNDSSSLTTDGTLEIIGSFKDTMYKKNGQRIWEGRYTVTAWDTGVYIFPTVQIALQDSVYSAQPALLTVSFEKKKIGDELDEVPVVIETDYWRWLKDWWWTLLIPLAIFIVLWIRKRNNKPVVRVLSLKDRSLLGLDALRKEAYWKKGDINRHYIEFSFLLRSFLSARYGLNLMERTTFETITLLRAKQIPEPTLERIRLLLQDSDIVKFALGVPDEESIVLGMNYMEQLILELSPLELIDE